MRIIVMGLLGLAWGCSTPKHDERLDASLINLRRQLVLYHTKYKYWKCQALVAEKSNVQNQFKVFRKDYQSLWNELKGIELGLGTCHMKDNRIPSANIIINNRNAIELINNDTLVDKNAFKTND